MNDIYIQRNLDNKSISYDNFIKESFNDDGNIDKRNKGIEPIFYISFKEPFNGKVKIDLLFNCDVYSEIPSNYYIEIFFNDDTSDSKTFKKQKYFIKYIKEVMKGNY